MGSGGGDEGSGGGGVGWEGGQRMKCCFALPSSLSLSLSLSLSHTHTKKIHGAAIVDPPRSIPSTAPGP